MWICDGWSGKQEGRMFHDFVSPFLYFWAWLIFLFLHGPSCVHFFFMGLHVPSSLLFFQYIAHALTRKNFWERLYGTWNIKEDMNEWMVWKCYPFAVEVLACGGGVYVILDHESMKRNSQRSQNLTKLKKIQAACR